MEDVMKNVIRKYRPELDIKELDDADRHEIAGSVAKIAPSSPLFGNSSIQASVASLAKKDAALSQSNTTVANDKKQLAADTLVETTSRAAFDGELTNLATLTATSATSASDVASMSFKPYVRAPVATGAPPVPDGIDVKIPTKGHGSAGVLVQQPKGARWQFVVQWSPNPPTATSWELLVGTGKSRTLTGASGTQMWVRAARVRGQLQSDWCTAILVTIP
jgi:hypothetical protein